MAVALSQVGRAPLFIDYRDPWAVSGMSSFAARCIQTSESAVLRPAAGAIVTTPELASQMQTRRPRLPVYLLPNGVDREVLPARSEAVGDGMTAVHLGAVYFGRDPMPLVRAFGEFKRLHPAASAESASLQFIGDVNEPHRSTIARLAQDAVFAGGLCLIPSMPRAEALQILARSSLSVVLAQNQSVMVPAKLYESVAIGVPTLVITEPGSASAAAAHRVGALQRDPDDVGGIAEVFAAAWRRDPSIRPRPGAKITHEQLAECADRIFRGAEAPFAERHHDSWAEATIP